MILKDVYTQRVLVRPNPRAIGVNIETEFVNWSVRLRQIDSADCNKSYPCIACYTRSRLILYSYCSNDEFQRLNIDLTRWQTSGGPDLALDL